MMKKSFCLFLLVAIPLVGLSQSDEQTAGPTIIPAYYVIWVLVAIHHPPRDQNESDPTVVGVFASEAECNRILDEYIEPQRAEYEKARCYSTRSPHLSGIHLLEQAKTWGLDLVINAEMRKLRQNCEMYYVPCDENP